MRALPGRVLRGLLTAFRTVTPSGRALILVGSVASVLGQRLSWLELTLLARVCGVLLVLGLVLVLLPRVVRTSLEVRPLKVVVGSTARARLVASSGLTPLWRVVVHVPVAGERNRVRLPLLLPGRPVDTVLDIAAPRRGVFPVGPVTHESRDLLGLFRRTSTWAPGLELFVRPPVVMLEPLPVGLVHDLEGVVSDQLSSSDLSFHALREYVPGDDMRQVHWRSSAKADTLLVRQYLDTRRSHATVVLDDSLVSYTDRQDFESAVAVAASIAVRAAHDDYELVFAAGGQPVERNVERALDACCRVGLDTSGFVEVAGRVAAVATGTSLVVLVTGAHAPGREVNLAASAFPSDTVRLVVRCDRAGQSRVLESGGLRMIELSRIEHLPVLLLGSKS
ncbi:MAG: hypothetical protein JWO46_1565 [Nocardioidaceae bacterium]|nr:hypothetical protein [Nocardioidaceae bacterium]